MIHPRYPEETFTAEYFPSLAMELKRRGRQCQRLF